MAEQEINRVSETKTQLESFKSSLTVASLFFRTVVPDVCNLSICSPVKVQSSIHLFDNDVQRYHYYTLVDPISPPTAFGFKKATGIDSTINRIKTMCYDTVDCSPNNIYNRQRAVEVIATDRLLNLTNNLSEKYGDSHYANMMSKAKGLDQPEITVWMASQNMSGWSWRDEGAMLRAYLLYQCMILPKTLIEQTTHNMMRFPQLYPISLECIYGYIPPQNSNMPPVPPSNAERFDKDYTCVFMTGSTLYRFCSCDFQNSEAIAKWLPPCWGCDVAIIPIKKKFLESKACIPYVYSFLDSSIWWMQRQYRSEIRNITNGEVPQIGSVDATIAYSFHVNNACRPRIRGPKRAIVVITDASDCQVSFYASPLGYHDKVQMTTWNATSNKVTLVEVPIFDSFCTWFGIVTVEAPADGNGLSGVLTMQESKLMDANAAISELEKMVCMGDTSTMMLNLAAELSFTHKSPTIMPTSIYEKERAEPSKDPKMNVTGINTLKRCVMPNLKTFEKMMKLQEFEVVEDDPSVIDIFSAHMYTSGKPCMLNFSSWFNNETKMVHIPGDCYYNSSPCEPYDHKKCNRRMYEETDSVQVAESSWQMRLLRAYEMVNVGLPSVVFSDTNTRGIWLQNKAAALHILFGWSLANEGITYSILSGSALLKNHTYSMIDRIYSVYSDNHLVPSFLSNHKRWDSKYKVLIQRAFGWQDIQTLENALLVAFVLPIPFMVIESFLNKLQITFSIKKGNDYLFAMTRIGTGIRRDAFGMVGISTVFAPFLSTGYNFTENGLPIYRTQTHISGSLTRAVSNSVSAIFFSQVAVIRHQTSSGRDVNSSIQYLMVNDMFVLPLLTHLEDNQCTIAYIENRFGEYLSRGDKEGYFVQGNIYPDPDYQDWVKKFFMTWLPRKISVAIPHLMRGDITGAAMSTGMSIVEDVISSVSDYFRGKERTEEIAELGKQEQPFRHPAPLQKIPPSELTSQGNDMSNEIPRGPTGGVGIPRPAVGGPQAPATQSVAVATTSRPSAEQFDMVPEAAEATDSFS